MMKEQYSEEWVMSRKNKNHGLEPLRRVLDTVGNPQNHLRIIHVAGTNGKGSTCNYLKDILQSQGYRVGMFTSPHLITHRDRIRCNNDYIPADIFRKYLLENIEQIEQNELGMFEIDTLIAFLWFRDIHVDYAIMECGLGGRLDNTNVIGHSELSMITSIGKDHMEILGNRLSQIAFEKAGILKPYGHLISHPLEPLCQSVIQHAALRKHAAYQKTKPYVKCGTGVFRFDDDTYELSTGADYQFKNAVLALTAAKYLGIEIHTERVHQALYDSKWLGRFEVVHEKPVVIIDGAHNEEGMKALVQSMQSLPHPLVTVFSALKDKPAHWMAEQLSRVSDRIYVTEFQNARAEKTAEMRVHQAIVVENYQDALEMAMKDCEKSGTVVVCGSLYFISIVRQYFIGN